MSDIKDRQTFFKYAPTADPAEGYATVFVDPTDDLIKVRDHLGNVREFVPKDLVVDNLTSTDADRPLSANQGKVLQDGKEPADNTILKESDVEDGLNSTSVTKPLSANQGKVLQDNKEDADNTILKEGDVENTLTSTSTTKPLSANQGKVLQDSKEDADSTILKEGDVENSLNSTSVTKPLSANQGKQLNDDKASLSGGGDANFAVMPQVGGSPIISRGSMNGDRWVRLADGTQFIWITVSVNLNGSDSGFASIPANFSNTRYSASFSLDVTTDRRDRVHTISEMAVATWDTDKLFWVKASGNNFNETRDVIIGLKGDWK